MPRVNVICPCGKKFSVPAHKIKIGKGKFCSKACMYKYRNQRFGFKRSDFNGNSSWFPKGNIPWNKGTRGLQESWSKGKKMGRRSIETEFKKGDNTDGANINWKGDDVGYYALHTYIIRHIGHANHCEWCGATDDKRYVWHNISGEYKRDVSDWVSLCPSCHIGYHYKKTKIRIDE